MIGKIGDYIDSREQEMLDLLKILVNMDSDSNDKAELDAVGKLLKKWWMKEDFDVEEFTYDDVGNCYIARFNQDKPGKKVLLIGHFDTVFPKGIAASRPFKIENGRAYGPGVGDMKGGLVTMLYAVKALKKERWLKGPVSVILNSHEETGSKYAKDIIEKESKNAGIAINLEPGRLNGDVITGRKGVAFLELFIKGQAAHAGVEPQKGVSANLELAHRIIEFQAFNGFAEGLTINATVVSGGHARNIIPDKAKANVDIRFVEKEDANLLYERILKSLFKPRVTGAKCKSKLSIMFPPMERKENVLQAYKLVCEAADKLKMNIGEAFTGGGADSAFTSQLGIPSICGMGPIGANPHRDDEYMEVSSVTERCKLLAISMAKFWDLI